MVRTRVRTMLSWYSSTTRVPVHVYVRTYPGIQYANGTYRWYVRSDVPLVRTYTCTYHGTKNGTRVLLGCEAHMLARIVVEIRAADIAVELEPQL